MSLIVINHAWSLLRARRSWAVTLLMLGLKAAVSVWTGGGPSAFTVTEWQHVGTHEWQMRIEMRVVSAWIQELATQHVYLLLIGATAWAGNACRRLPAARPFGRLCCSTRRTASLRARQRPTSSRRVSHRCSSS